MNRRIMTPVELLAEGAQRIENGDLDEAIVYNGWVTAQNDGGLKICLYFPKEAKNIGKNTDCRG